MRNWKREKANPRHRRDLDDLLTSVLEFLVVDESMPIRNRDQALSGDWNGYRECHIKPDLLLSTRFRMNTPCGWLALDRTVSCSAEGYLISSMRLRGSGTGRPSSPMASRWNAIPSRMRRLISSRESPVAIQPGRSGT